MLFITDSFFVQLLLFVLTFYVVYTLTHKWFKQRIPSLIIAVSIALITINYLELRYISLLYHSYGLAGILFISIVPLILILQFIYRTGISKTARRIMVAAYGALLIIIFANGDTSTRYPYLIEGTIILFILLIIFDPLIKKAFRRRT